MSSTKVSTEVMGAAKWPQTRYRTQRRFLELSDQRRPDTLLTQYDYVKSREPQLLTGIVYDDIFRGFLFSVSMKCIHLVIGELDLRKDGAESAARIRRFIHEENANLSYFDKAFLQVSAFWIGLVFC